MTQIYVSHSESLLNAGLINSCVCLTVHFGMLSGQHRYNEDKIEQLVLYTYSHSFPEFAPVCL